MLTVSRAPTFIAGRVDRLRGLVGPPDDWTGTDAPTEGVVLIAEHIDPTNPRRVYDLDSRAERKYLYEVVLVDGDGADINRLIARAFLVDLWDGLYLPQAVRAAWATTLDMLRSAGH